MTLLERQRTASDTGGLRCSRVRAPHGSVRGGVGARGSHQASEAPCPLAGLLWSPRICSGLTRRWCRKEQQQKEWEGRQADRKAREAEMAGEPFDREVGPQTWTEVEPS